MNDQMYPKVQINWNDAYSPLTDVWRTVEDALNNCEENMLCTTIGYLIKETDKSYVLADTVAWFVDQNTAMVRGLINIPKGCVDSIITI